ncbi:MAG TPA: hypothetical protein VFP86_14360 [bacterium]|nr:hypothetical protein [bacterium]
MRTWKTALILALGTAILVGVWTGSLAQAQLRAQMPMNPQGMQMGQMMQQMQMQRTQMNATVSALRKQLEQINPDLLTGQERPMYTYLKILQGHLENMGGMMGTMQDTMMKMPGMPRR